MSEFDLTGDLEPEELPDEEEYEADAGATSPDTGTFYDDRGAAELTPHDLEDDDEGEE
jgi:hypothetical protein